MAEIAKKYSSEGFMGCNDSLESVLFSAMMEMEKFHLNKIIVSAEKCLQKRTRGL